MVVADHRKRLRARASRLRAGTLTLAIKRLTDLAFVLIAAPLVLPLGLAIAGAIRWKMGAPVLYRQVRPGRDCELFHVWKFRTMGSERDTRGQLLPDRERLTPLGRFLRERSLDELPQLANLLKGEMSLVGPRPLLVRYLDRYTERQLSRHLVKPGITGWAQVNGRNALDWDSRLELDVWYAENVSPWLDVRILAKTVVALIRGGDVMAGAGADFDEFWGANGPPADGPTAFPVEEDESENEL